MSDERKQELPDLSADESAYAEPVRGGFDPQPDPPRTIKSDSVDMPVSSGLMKKRAGL